MTEFKNIVLTTDLSANADVAIPFAVALAKRNEGMINVFHAFEVDSKDALADGVVVGASAWIRSIRQQRERNVAALANRISENFGVITHYTVADGNAAAEVARFAIDSRADVIVTATHGRTGLTHLVLGSVAERILRLSLIPVLTVRPGELAFDSNSKFKTILLPTDFSENAAAAQPYAIALAKKDGAKLSLVHVVDDSIYYTTLEPGVLMPDLECLTDALRADAERSLSDVAASILTKFGVKCEQIAASGRIAEQICAIAKERQADLIVISTHGYTGLSHLVFGSVAEKVVRSSPVPVLSIKPQTIVEHK